MYWSTQLIKDGEMTKKGLKILVKLRGFIGTIIYIHLTFNAYLIC